MFRHLNQWQNPMDQASVVHGQTGGIFGHSKTLKIEEREFDHTTSDGQYYKFFLVDTPGYGDHVNVRKNFQPVVDFITRGSRRYLAEIKMGNDTPSEDGRADVCLYFIAAHRCKPIDMEYIKQLSKVVAVIPVIGKSDSMTVDEMIDFKKAIADSAAQANGLEFFNFSERAWEKCLAALNIADEPIWLGERRPPPYAVISSQVDDPNGKAHAPDPVRRYPWGECHVMRPEHSDNTYLQCLLLEVGFQDMKDEMKKRYEAFKKQEAKLLVTRIGEKIWEYRLAIASGKPSIISVVLALIFTFVAVILATTEVNLNEPSTGLADWSEVILKIQQVKGSDRVVTAVDSGEETLDVLMEVLMDDRKMWTETSEEAQREAPSGRKAATIGKDPAAKGTDHPQVPDEPATQSTATQTSGSVMMPDDGSSRNSQSLRKTEEATSFSSTSNPAIESDKPVSIYYILGYSALSVLLATCGLVVWAVVAFLKVGSHVFATAFKCSSLFREARGSNTIAGRPHGVANGALGDLHGNPRGGAGRSDHLCQEYHGTLVERGEGGCRDKIRWSRSPDTLNKHVEMSGFGAVPAFVVAPSSTRLFVVQDTSSQGAKATIEEGAATQEADLSESAAWSAGTQPRGFTTTPNGVPPQTDLSETINLVDRTDPPELDLSGIINRLFAAVQLSAAVSLCGCVLWGVRSLK
ncbi:unnamed protein product [Ectocarpus sp. CCAP 1310/34]|nr:unnamed protein product [Ectocarpus sp. CCAP 1310/34]